MIQFFPTHLKKIMLRLLFYLFAFSTIKISSGLHPVILIPGDGGNQIEAKLDKPSVVHYICSKKSSDFFNIWLNLELLVPLVIDCWIDNLRLVYNKSCRSTSNSPGVEIRVPGFGQTETVEYLDPSKASQGLYFKTIVEESLVPLGYERNVNIHGAPYDFRKGPNELSDWLTHFKSLVESTFESNEKNRVILITHSMGSPLTLYFLSLMTHQWKNKYIRSVVTLSGPWGGSVKALKVFACGDDLGASLLPSHTLRNLQRTYPSSAFLLPSSHFWSLNETLLTLPPSNTTEYGTGNRDKHSQTLVHLPPSNTTKAESGAGSRETHSETLLHLSPSRTTKAEFGPENRETLSETLVELPPSRTMKTEFGVGDWEDIFSLMDFPDAWLMWKDSAKLLNPLEGPGVEVHCLYGTGISTVDSLSYKKMSDFPLKPQLVYGNGDGTVNIRSLRGCLKWSSVGEKILKRKIRSKYTTNMDNQNNSINIQKKETVFHQEFPGAEHLEILKNPNVINYIKTAVGAMNNELN